MTREGYLAPGAGEHEAPLQGLEHLGTASRASLSCSEYALPWDNPPLRMRYLSQERGGASSHGGLLYLSDCIAHSG